MEKAFGRKVSCSKVKRACLDMGTRALLGLQAGQSKNSIIGISEFEAEGWHPSSLEQVVNGRSAISATLEVGGCLFQVGSIPLGTKESCPDARMGSIRPRQAKYQRAR